MGHRGQRVNAFSMAAHSAPGRDEVERLTQRSKRSGNPRVPYLDSAGHLEENPNTPTPPFSPHAKLWRQLGAAAVEKKEGEGRSADRICFGPWTHLF